MENIVNIYNPVAIHPTFETHFFEEDCNQPFFQLECCFPKLLFLLIRNFWRLHRRVVSKIMLFEHVDGFITAWLRSFTTRTTFLNVFFFFFKYFNQSTFFTFFFEKKPSAPNFKVHFRSNEVLSHHYFHCIDGARLFPLQKYNMNFFQHIISQPSEGVWTVEAILTTLSSNRNFAVCFERGMFCFALEGSSKQFLNDIEAFFTRQ